MANLTNYQQKEKAAIASEALSLIPTHHTARVYPTLCDLSELAVFDKSYLQEIQHLIDLARADNLAAIERLKNQVDLLRDETITAFNNVGNEIDSLSHRVKRLENQPQSRKTTNINVNFDQTGHAICWLIIGVLAIATVGTLLNIPLGTSQQPRTEVKQP